MRHPSLTTTPGVDAGAKPEDEHSAVRKRTLLGWFELELATLAFEPTPELCTLLGCEHREALSLEQATKHVLPLDREAALAAFRAAAAGGRDRVEADVRIRKPDGPTRWIRASARISYGSDGVATRILGAAVDATETAAESERAGDAFALEAAERIFDGVPAPIAVLHGEDELVVDYVNPTCVALFQRQSATELLGRPIVEALPELGEHPEHLRSVIRSGVSTSRREVPVVIDGPAGPATKYFDFTYSPVPNAGGAIDRACVIAFEVTSVVSVRREAELANRTKDEFLATLSHELRTPLNAMLGWASLLQKDSSDLARLSRGLAVIERNALAQAKIVGDLLDVSRILGGKLVLNLRSTPIAAVVGAALEASRPAAESRGVRLVVELAPEVTAIAADAHRLQQVLWNLLSNAVRFTPSGGEVRVATRANATSLSIEVVDTGRGIPAEHLPHVFERFHQVDGSITRTHGGLGLGLSIVRYIVEAHGGTVRAASAGADRGATFTIELPLGAAEAPSHPEPEPVSTGPITPSRRVVVTAEPLAPPETTGVFPTRQPLLGIRVLLVDDEGDCLEFLQQELENAGARVTTARDAAAALATPGPVDVIVSDIGMPGMDGYAYLKELRASQTSAANAPAIALTAYARPEDVERAYRAGYREHVAKPCDVPRLVGLIRRLALAAAADRVAAPRS